MNNPVIFRLVIDRHKIAAQCLGIRFCRSPCRTINHRVIAVAVFKPPCRHSLGSGTSDRLRRAVAIGITCHHGDGLAHLCLSQVQGASGRTADVDARSLPLIADRTQPIQIDQCIGCLQCLALSGTAGDRHAAGRVVVDIGYRQCGVAAERLGRANPIDIVGGNGNGLADLRLGQYQDGVGRTADVDAIGEPLEADIPQQYGIG